MEIEEIKSIPIAGYLDRKGEKPTKKRGNCLFYRAFWRGGDNPVNVKVETDKNIWFDYGAGNGGTIIDLVMVVEHLTNGEAIAFLSQYGTVPDAAQVVSKYTDIHIVDDNAGTGVVKEIRDIFFFPLQNYLQERGISLAVARRFCKEVHYQFQGHPVQSALGFMTVGKAIILRNKYFKGCIFGQDISIIKGVRPDAFAVFEGFFDFLSFVEIWGVPKINAMVLNSVGNIRKAYSYFDTARAIYLLLDNDAKGLETTRFLQEKYGDKVIVKSDVFAPYKDLNAFLLKKC